MTRIGSTHIIIGSAVVLVSIGICSLMEINKNSTNELKQKIETFSNQIIKTKSTEERLRLKKDILIIEKDLVLIESGASNILFPGAIALLAAVTGIVGLKNFDLSKEYQTSDQLIKLIEILNTNEQPSARIAAIYALEKISDNHLEYRTAIAESLSTFIRDNFSNKALPVNKIKMTESDLQAVFNVLGRKHLSKYAKNKILDLTNCDLTGIKVKGGSFENTDFSNSSLINTHFDKTDFLNVDFTGVDISGANLSTCKKLKKDQLLKAKHYKNTETPKHIDLKRV
jgi:Pentapeptide repeats (8 copies)